MKKTLKCISNIMVWFVVAIAIFMMIFTIVSVNTFNRNDRELLGHRFYIVLSDSMSASDIDAGDLVVIKEVDPTTLQEGDIIAYQSQNSENYGATVTHMIRTKTTDAKGNPGFITYGTTTGVDDDTVVTYPFILGKYQMVLPKVGTFFQFLKTPQGYIVCILIPFLLLILYQGLNCVKLFKMYKAEQMEELQAEKDALEAQRKQSEDMMAQLLAMQQMMAQQNQAAAPPAPTTYEPVSAPAENKQSIPQEITSTAEVTAQTEEQIDKQPDVAAMMAELETLRAQLAAQNQAAAAAEAETKTDGTKIDETHPSEEKEI